MDLSTVIFLPTGAIQTYLVPVTGGYLIEAGGAQAAPGEEAAGAKGDRVKGMFYLNRGDILKIVVGSQRPARPLRRLSCGGEGGSIVWRGAGELPLPAKLMLAAGGGHRAGQASPDDSDWGDSFNAGAFQSNTSAVQSGDGFVSIKVVPVAPDPRPGASVRTARESPAARALPEHMNAS